MAQRPFRFIHIGLPKAASTFLQQVLFEGCGARVAPLREINDFSRKVALTNGDVPAQLPDVKVVGQGEKLVISSEGLVSPFLNVPERHNRVTSAQRIAAEMVGPQALSDDLVLIVRDPVKWVRSMHHQSIKEGGAETFAEFMESHATYLRAVLDFRYVVECWTKYVPNLHVLPMEYLRDDEQGFLRALCRIGRLPQPAPSKLKLIRSSNALTNRSDSERLPLMVHMNAMTQRITEIYDGLQDVPANEEKYKAALLAGNKWVTRRIVELAPDSEFEAFRDLVSFEDDGAVTQGTVPGGLLDAMADNFLAPLAEGRHIPHRYIRAYEASIAAEREAGEGLKQAAVSSAR